MKAVIFGAAGQDGIYLSGLLQEQGIETIAVSRSAGYRNINIADAQAVEDLMAQCKPEFAFHLAANSTTRHEALLENHATIATGTIHLLEAVKKVSPHTKVFISGSGLQFHNADVPIKETDPFEARDAYSVARIHSVYAARYFRSLGIQAYVGYFFNHDSPLRTERHMTMKIAAASRRIAQGSSEKLEIGDLDVVKEYGFAGDIVKAVWKLVNQQDVWEANLATGMGYSIRDWVIRCFEEVHLSWQDYVISKPGFKAEYRRLVADASLIASLGWKPEVDFNMLCKLMMNPHAANQP